MFGFNDPSGCFTPNVIFDWPNCGISDSTNLYPSTTKPLEFTFTLVKISLSTVVSLVSSIFFNWSWTFNSNGISILVDPSKSTPAFPSKSEFSFIFIFTLSFNFPVSSE